MKIVFIKLINNVLILQIHHLNHSNEYKLKLLDVLKYTFKV